MPPSEEKVEAELSRLHTIDRASLLSEWMKAFKNPPLKGARDITLIRALSYHAQEKTYGRLKPSTLKKLKKIVRSHADYCCDALNSPPPSKPSSGSQLIREWNGKTHSVRVTDDGFLWNGVIYTSLSSVAHAITGARWSGPRFFGLKGRIS